MSKISALLGPTNTGKTYTALEKLFNYENGVIGFPLRLLARENYELGIKKAGVSNVALITGEEKIIPSNPKYFFCTVESIPSDIDYEFVAIDEVQLAADYERGYLFTERILGMQGQKETMFLGSKSMENILQKLFPEISIHYKQRLSKICYSGYKNISRLPKRSAIIAFSQIDVYEIAEKIKQFFGGVSVVMGALSPEVRNAQVKLFEEGKVDYLVATDAIGLGLNLNIKNIFFTDLLKFDGKRRRYLSYDEIAQIAGRAGRFINDGFFGTTGKLKSLSNTLVRFIEDLEYTKINRIYWRNSKLNFSSHSELINSLNLKPQNKILLQKKNAQDFNCLKILISDKKIKKIASSKIKLKLLWNVCCIPDYTNIFDDFHSKFLFKIFIFLVENKKIPDYWIKEQLKKIKKRTPKISELNFKIAQIRMWSFLVFKKNWLNKSADFQIKVQKIELELSKYLHECLINQFIGEYSNIAIDKHSNADVSNLIIFDDNKIIIGKSIVAELKGLNFLIKYSFKKKKNFNTKILNKNLLFFSQQIIKKFKNCNFEDLSFNIKGQIFWEKHLIAHLFKGQKLLKPRIKIYVDSYFKNYERDINVKIENFFSYHLKKNLPFLDFSRGLKKSSVSQRAIFFALEEGLGHCFKDEINNFYYNLKKESAKKFKDLGFKNGNKFFFFQKSKLSLFNQMVVNIFYLLNLKKFFFKNFYKVENINEFKENLKYIQKMGFYLVKINGENSFLIHFSYFEKTLNKVYSLKKSKNKKIKNNFIKNSFEQIAFDNVSKVNLLDYS